MKRFLAALAISLAGAPAHAVIDGTCDFTQGANSTQQLANGCAEEIGAILTTLTGLPGLYAPLSHTHVAANITDFASAVAALITGKADLASPTFSGLATFNSLKATGIGLPSWEVISAITSNNVDIQRSWVALSVGGGGTINTITDVSGAGLRLLYLRNSGGSPITITHGASTIRLNAGVDKVLSQFDGIVLVEAADGIWQEFGGLGFEAAPLASPTFTGTVTLPAGQVINGVTLTTGGPSTEYLSADGSYSEPAGGGAGTTVISNADTGVEDDWSPAGYAAGHTIIEWAGTSFLHVTGFPAGSAGDKITFANNSTESVVLFQHLATGSTAGQRVRASANNHEHGLIFPGEQAEFVFNGTLDQWVMARPVSGPRAEWTHGATQPGTGSAPTVMGMAALSLGGSVGHATTGSPSDYASSFLRLRLDTGSGSSGRVAGLRDQPRLPIGSAADMGGFVLRTVWGYDTLTSNTNSFFVGASSNGGSPGGVNFSTQTNMVGWGKDDSDGDSTFLMHNDASGVATKVALSSDFDQHIDRVFDGWVYLAPNGSKYTMIVWRADDYTVAPSIIEVSTDLPAATFLNRFMYISNVAGSDRYILNLKENEQWLN